MAKEIRRSADTVPLQEKIFDTFVDPHHRLATEFEDKLRHVLNNTSLDVGSRIAVYLDMLRRYIILSGRDILPKFLMQAEEEEEEEEEEEPLNESVSGKISLANLDRAFLIKSASSTVKQAAAVKKILHIIEGNENLGLTKDYQLVHLSRVLQNSNINQILKTLVSRVKRPADDSLPIGVAELLPFLSRDIVLNRSIPMGRKKRRKL